MKKIQKLLNKAFDDKTFTKLIPKTQDSCEKIYFPFGVIHKIKTGEIVLSISLDTPMHIVFYLSKILTNTKIVVCENPTWQIGEFTYWNDEAVLEYAKHIIMEYNKSKNTTIH